MRKANGTLSQLLSRFRGRGMITLVSLTLVVLAGPARAQEAPATPVATTLPPEPAPPPRARRIELGVSFLPMSLGTFTASYGGMRIPGDAAFAPGVSLSAGYAIVPRYLSVGLAPQVIFNVGTKEDPSGSGNPVIMSRELDIMARVVGSLPLVDTIAVYAELLPGYSLIKPSDGDPAKGFVLAGGVGVAMDLTERMFVNLGVGYQRGFQSRIDTGMTGDVKTDVTTEYWRGALGLGWRL
jgi:hypothetical protein